MNKRIVFILIQIAFYSFIAKSQNSPTTLCVEVPDSFSKDSLIVKLNSIDDFKDSALQFSVKVNDRIALFRFDINEPKLVTIYDDKGSSMLSRTGVEPLLEPGDSIYIKANASGLAYSGRGYEKFEILYRIEELEERFPGYSRWQYLKRPESVEDFLNLSANISQRINRRISLLQLYKNHISLFAFSYIQAQLIGFVEYERVTNFLSLYFEQKKLQLTNENLINIFDTILAVSPARKLVSEANIPLPIVTYLFEYTRLDYSRSLSFKDYSVGEPTNERVRRIVSYYDIAKTKYKGVIREKLLAYIIRSWLIKRIGFVPEVEVALTDYYSSPGYPEYKQLVREYEGVARTLVKGQTTPDFTLTTMSGASFSKSDVGGKIVLMDFWFTGCTGCVAMAPMLNKVKKVFGGNPNVAYLSVSVDKEKNTWLKSVASKKYTFEQDMNLYTGGLGRNHPVVKQYNVTSYPRLYIVDAYGKIATNHVPRPDSDSGKALTSLIEKQLTEANDGPYMLYHGSKLVAKYVTHTNGKLVVREENYDTSSSNLGLPVSTDEYEKKFWVKLKEKLKTEPCEFYNVSKQLVLSDIEGNFSAFRKLLQSNRVIDQNYNWTFGDGHLVLIGDFFDRGNQVTECLWLIYSLEEKAKACGGYVHFIMGNHEIMNLSGDFRYVQTKYKTNSELMSEEYHTLYSRNSELGSWLRTKNVIEKIGDVLYVHGGISKEVNCSNFNIEKINEIVRLYYDVPVGKIIDTSVLFLVSNKTAPHWYREYYEWDKKAHLSQIDSTLKKFGTTKIVTGHTVIADTISVCYGGRVINVDTQHSKGASEALLIEGTNYYRVNADGKRTLLFRLNGDEYTTRHRVF